MKDAPKIVPKLPDDFIRAFVTNKHIGDGTPTIVWGRPKDIKNLNRGATVTHEIFVVGESLEDDGFKVITPADGQQYIDNLTAMGYSDIRCGSPKIDGWTVNWFSGLRSPDRTFFAWLTKPNRGQSVAIELIAGEEGLPLWTNFINSIERSEQFAAGNRP